MSIVNSIPTVNTSPNIGGSSPVTGISNTGHDTTVTNTSAVDVGAPPSQDNTLSKTAKWSAFGSFPAGTINSLHLKLNWDIVGSLSANSGDVGADGSGEITFTIDYSLNGGGAWINALTKTRDVSAGSGSSDSDSIDENGAIDITLLVGQDVSQVQVRDSMVSHAAASAIPGSGGANASISQTTFITDIKLEADITLSSPSSGRRKAIVLM